MKTVAIYLLAIFIVGCGGSSGSGSGGSGSTSTVPAAVAYNFDAQFSSFIGGTFFERAQAVHVDAAGFIYVGGHTGSADFPVSANAYDTTKSPPSGPGNDTADGFVAKLTPDGATLIWSTLIGGTKRDQVYAVRTDSAGNVYVVGATGSGDFPSTPGAYDQTFNGPVMSNGLSDIFVASLTADGTTLRFSTFVGGALGGEENPRGAIEIDEQNGRIYVAGVTTAADFPITAGAYQPGYGGGADDGFVFALSLNGRNLIASTFIGGNGSDMAFTEIERNPVDNSLYIAGATNSPDFPVTPGVFQTNLADGNPGDAWWASGDAFVARLSADLDSLLFSTLFGGSGADAVSHNQGLAIDSRGRAVLVGHTESADLPVSQDAFDTSLNGVSDGFVAIFTQQGALASATYLGGSQSEEVAGAFVGPQDRVYLTGGTRSDDFVVTTGAYQSTFGNSVSGGNLSDAFLTVFDAGLRSVEYSTYLGGSGSMAWAERGRSVWVADNGRALVGGVTDSSDFPLQAPSVQSRFGGDTDGFIIAFDPLP